MDSPKDFQDDIVMAILSKMGVNNLNKKLVKMHVAFYRLKQEPKYEKYLKGFDFDEMGIYPYSSELYQVLTRIESAQLLETSNPSFAKYTINVDYMKGKYNIFPPDQQKDIEEMSAKLLDYIS